MSKLFRYKIISSFFLLFLSQLLLAQVEIVPGDQAPFDNPEDLIRNVFLGEGVIVENVIFTGSVSSVAYFGDAEDDIGIERGIVMTTGRAIDVNGIGCAGTPEDSSDIDDCGNSGTSDSFINASASDADLVQISGQDINDAVLFEIDFIPLSDTLRFQYVFASEEYPEYVCANFNDAFGFFISGPGYTSGSFQNGAENIALIPGTILPVAINTVNPGASGSQGNGNAACTSTGGSLDHADKYNDNGTSTSTDIAGIVYDGYTNVFTAEAIVVPCQSYKIKLAIGDASDQRLDSGVFLAAKSFGTGTLQVKTQTSSIDGTIAEGCGNAAISFSLPFPAVQDEILNYNIFGSAISGVDYEPIPASITIPQGETTAEIVIVPIEDSNGETADTFYLEIQKNVCELDTLRVIIKDDALLGSNMPDTTSICPNGNVALDATLPVAIPPVPSFTNTDRLVIPSPSVTGENLLAVQSEIQVSGVVPEEIDPLLSIDSVCINLEHFWPGDLDIYLVAPSGEILELTTDNGAKGTSTATDGFLNTCFTPSAMIHVDSIPPCPNPAACPNFAPFNGNWLPEGVWTDLGGAEANGTWQLILTDDSRGFEGALVDWSISFKPRYEIAYNWMPSTGLSCDNCPTPIASPSETTQYTVAATDSYGCTVFDTTTVVVLDSLPPPAAFCANISVNNISVEWPLLEGAISYELSIDGGAWIAANPGPLQHDIVGLSGNQSIDISLRGIDACGIGRDTTITCTTSACATAYTLVNQRDISCKGDDDGVLDINVTAGEAPFSFQLNGANVPAPPYTNLAASDYILTILDRNACPISYNFTISEPDLLLSDSLSVAPLCNGALDGQAIVTVEGGTYPYRYLWNTSPVQNDSVATGLGAGTYIVTITDDMLCETRDTVIINEPSRLTALSDSIPILCFGASTGSAIVIPSGGTPPYNYLWNDTNAQTTATASNLPAGLYEVIIEDNNGCQLNREVEVTQNPTMFIEATANSPVCFSAEIQLAVSTGQSYTWSGPNGFESMQQNPIINNANSAKAGDYFVTVTDGNNCPVLDTIAVVVLDSIEATSLSIIPSCIGIADASAEILTIEGGSGAVISDYNIIWNTTTAQNGLNLSNVEGGQSYIATITDASGCIGTHELNIANPDTLKVILTGNTGVTCNGGSDGELTVEAQGGTGTYSYQWDSNAASQTGTTASGLGLGFYEVIVMDANDCMVVGRFEVETASSIIIQLEKTDLTCFAADDGIIQSTISGGTPPYSYTWSNGMTGEGLSNLAPGDYTLNIVDNTACTQAASITISEPDSVEIEVVQTDLLCFEGADATLLINVEGGTPAYEYSIDGINFQATNLFENLDAGNYEIAVRDAEACVYTATSMLEEPAMLNVELAGLANEIIAEEGDTIILNTIANDDIGVLEYEWSSQNGGVLSCSDCSNPTVIVNNSDTYLLTVSDENGCMTTLQVKITVDKLRDIFVPSGFTPNGDGQNDIFFVHGKTGTKVLAFRVFDRWGEQVFLAEDYEVNDESTAWDGTFLGEKMNTGVYVWIAEIEYEDGYKRAFKGNVTLMR